MMDVRLETERLILREIEEEDWVSVHGYAQNPAVCRFLPWGPNTEQETKEFLRGLQAERVEEPRKRVSLGLVCRDSGEFIGGIGISRSGGDAREAEVGYCLHADYWGKGYATEAARAMIDFGLREWHMHRIHARVDPENLGSVHVLEKCGMRREGHFRKLVWVKGEWRDRLMYAILEEEWTSPACPTRPTGPTTL